MADAAKPRRKRAERIPLRERAVHPFFLLRMLDQPLDTAAGRRVLLGDMTSSDIVYQYVKPMTQEARCDYVQVRCHMPLNPSMQARSVPCSARPCKGQCSNGGWCCCWASAGCCTSTAHVRVAATAPPLARRPRRARTAGTPGTASPASGRTCLRTRAASTSSASAGTASCGGPRRTSCPTAGVRGRNAHGGECAARRGQHSALSQHRQHASAASLI